MTFGDVDGSWEDSRAIVTTTLNELTTEVLATAREQGISPRAAAQAKVDANLAALSAASAELDVAPASVPEI